MKRLFHAKPQAVVYDLHPHYLSTQFAQKLQTPRRIGVQHHHAHIAACMTEHSLEGKVIGVAWDGTGYGTDGTIWGGEFLIADLNASPTCVTSHWLAETPPYSSPGASRAAIFVMRWTPSPWPPCAARPPYRKHRFACLMQCLKNGSRPSTPPPVDASSTLTYNYSLTNLEILQVDMRPTIRQIVGDVVSGVPTSEISARFHNALITLVAAIV
jgi:hydrogenase maturation factor HypF (carbamoyltransferase family)